MEEQPVHEYPISEYLHRLSELVPSEWVFLFKRAGSSWVLLHAGTEGAVLFERRRDKAELPALASAYFDPLVWKELESAIPFAAAEGRPRVLDIAERPLVLAALEMEPDVFACWLQPVSAGYQELRSAGALKDRYEASYFHSLDMLLTVDNEYTVLETSYAVEELLGYRSDELVGQPFFCLLEKSRIDRWRGVLDHIDAAPAKVGNASIYHKAGHLMPFLLTVIPIRTGGRRVGSHIVLRDTSAFSRQKEKLDFLTYRDYLTGLWNRRALKEQLQARLLEAGERRAEVTLMYIDLDRFRLINDTLGYQTGDELLKSVAERLKAFCGSERKLFRQSGDEFAFLFLGAEQGEVREAADAILRALGKPFYLRHQEFFLSASLGISVYPHDGATADELMQCADQALFVVKNRGRAHYRYYEKEMAKTFPNSVLMESHLRRAIEKGELSVHYQPQVDLVSGQIDSFEALLRWNNRKFGFVSPGQFIPLAEKSGLIFQLGEWVIGAALSQLREWQLQGMRPVRIAINISPEQFKQEHFVDFMRSQIEQYGVDPRSVEVEITESAMANKEETITILEQLKELGVIISVDDFGTGYSSLSYLKTYPIDIIKIDQSFIRDIQSNSKDAAIAKTIIQLAHNLGMDVVAEGVEVDDQVRFLKEAHCQKAQGYFFSRPVPIQEINDRYMNGS